MASKLNKNTLLSSAGRPSWYDQNGQSRPAFLIGIAGGSASGKTRVAAEILKALAVPWVLTVSQDSFYKSLTPDQSKLAFSNQYDFDSPPAFDFEALRRCLVDLKESRSCQIPTYSFSQHQRLPETQYLYGATIVIVEGIFVLQDPAIRDLLDLKIFVQADSDLMLARRIRRDTIERGRDVHGILQQYLTFVKPSFDNFVLPTAKHADITIPGLSNNVAISLVVTHIQNQLESRRKTHLRPLLSRAMSHTSQGLSSIAQSPPPLPENVHMLDISGDHKQQIGIQTVLRNDQCSREDFIFFSNRLATLLIEESMRFLPSRSKSITTDTGYLYEGTELDVENLCAFTIQRSGEVLEMGLRRVLRDVPMCSALIQSDPATGEPYLYQLSISEALKKRETANRTRVLVLDAQIGTAAAALMAVRILLDHGVPEENITVVVILLSRAAVDDELREMWIPHNEHDGAWRGDESELLSTDDEDEEADGSPVEQCENGESPSSLLNRGMNRARSTNLKRPESADTRGKKVWSIIPGMGSYGTRFFGC